MLQLLVCVRVSRGTFLREGRRLTRVSCRSVNRSALRRRSRGAAGRLPGRRGGWWLGSHLVAPLLCRGCRDRDLSNAHLEGARARRSLHQTLVQGQDIVTARRHDGRGDRRHGDVFLQQVFCGRFQVSGFRSPKAQGQKYRWETHFKASSQISAPPRFQISDPKTRQISDFRFYTSDFRLSASPRASDHVALPLVVVFEDLEEVPHLRRVEGAVAHHLLAHAFPQTSRKRFCSHSDAKLQSSP